MRGTSSTSFGEVLRQAETAFAAETGSLETIAEELFSVADAIDSSNQLVRLLSDAGRPAEVKESAVRTLLGGRAAAPALDATLDVVGHHWSEQEDILDALELLGVAALLDQAQREGNLELVESELLQVSRLIDGSAELSRTLDGARGEPAQRPAIMTQLLEGRSDRLTIFLASRAVGRVTEFKPARRVEEFARFASERRRRSFAFVTSAVPLNEEQQARLGSLLAGIYGREIHINLQVDPDVVGGLRIQVGDDLYDATVLARLSRAREQLVA